MLPAIPTKARGGLRSWVARRTLRVFLNALLVGDGGMSWLVDFEGFRRQHSGALKLALEVLHILQASCALV